MIARLWHGRVPATKAEAYLRLMREVALPNYRQVQGNRGAWCLTRADGDVSRGIPAATPPESRGLPVVHFEMLTFWDDVPSIKRFAGEQYEVAKYYDFDPDYLLEMEPHVRHYDAHDS